MRSAIAAAYAADLSRRASRDFDAELRQARASEDWVAHARIWEDRRHADVTRDESILRKIG